MFLTFKHALCVFTIFSINAISCMNECTIVLFMEQLEFYLERSLLLYSLIILGFCKVAFYQGYIPALNLSCVLEVVFRPYTPLKRRIHISLPQFTLLQPKWGLKCLIFQNLKRPHYLFRILC